ncbi:intraflagellar transport protein 52 homolog [Condylostylus longicornis]|uniref:intraflagellar transport protein 52 homolog n=1 Tax=Condylostylus longicornis TaxID=2530218 RepID=UPI00244E4D62|nr:intraflagellar transport protein 52 homolog [Condylostylus longicornis]
MIQKGVVCFDISKNELFQLADNYKTLHRKIKVSWKVEQNDAELSKDVLSKANIFIISGPQDKFTEDEFNALKEFIENGGKLLVMLGEGGENAFNTNINFFLEDYGMFINNDTVLRPHYFKNFHPKECIIGGGIVCESMWRYLLNEKIEKIDYEFTDEKYKIHFQYPYGATMNVSEPANILLTTGPVVYPFNRPLVGYYCNEKNGKILAIGSGHMFQDKYLTDKTNDIILDYFLNLLSNDDIKFTHLDFNDVEINDNKTVSDIGFIAEIPKPCLVESTATDIPADFKKMFDMNMFTLSNDLLKDVIDAYSKLNVKYEPLKIIKPQFDIPLPPLQLAVFPPIFSEPPPPPLELFDLDEHLSSPRTQLDQLTIKCLSSIKDSQQQKKEFTTKDLEYFIRECGRIVGIVQEGHEINAKEILYNVGLKIANYKKIDRKLD